VDAIAQGPMIRPDPSVQRAHLLLISDAPTMARAQVGAGQPGSGSVSETTVAVRLLLAVLISGLLGFERELKGQVAGLRTHVLVAIGACLFTLVGAFAFDSEHADVTRIASQVVVGIGFSGGGAIVRHGTSVRGLTTAANLWVSAAIGVSVGVGFYVAAAIAAGLALVVLTGLKAVEHWLGHRQSEPTSREPPPP
jgi:putative Mg2+ transporter-C (MgtC) family protein